MSAQACEHCGGRLLRDLELGAEVFSTEPVLKCINCGRVPGVRRAPTAEESGASGVRREATPRAFSPWGESETEAWERRQAAPALEAVR